MTGAGTRCLDPTGRVWPSIAAALRAGLSRSELREAVWRIAADGCHVCSEGSVVWEYSPGLWVAHPGDGIGLVQDERGMIIAWPEPGAARSAAERGHRGSGQQDRMD